MTNLGRVCASNLRHRRSRTLPPAVNQFGLTVAYRLDERGLPSNRRQRGCRLLQGCLGNGIRPLSDAEGLNETCNSAPCKVDIVSPLNIACGLRHLDPGQPNCSDLTHDN